MKRLLACFLSFLLAFGCLYGSIPAGATVTAPGGANLIANGDFSAGTGYTTNTTLPAVTDSYVTGLKYRTWFRATSLTGAIGNDSDSHGNYLQTKQYAFCGVPLVTGDSYTLTFDFKGTPGTKNVQLYLCDATVRGTPLVIGDVTKNEITNPTTDRILIEKSSSWTTYTVTFKVGSPIDSAKNYAIAFYDVDYNSTSNPVFLDLDNVTLYDTSVVEVPVDPNELVPDGGFESTQNTYTANNSDTATLSVLPQQAATTTPNNIWHQAQGKNTQFSRVATDDKYQGNASCIVNPYIYEAVETTATTAYQLSFWAKARSFNALTFRLVSTDNRATAINTEGTRTAALTDQWVKYTYKLTMPQSVSGTTLLSFFTKTNSTAYANYNANDAYLDNVSLKQMYTISATAEPGGTATVSSSAAVIGDQVAFTAAPDNGNIFKGWYASGATDPVSTSAVYTVTVSGNLSLTAKFDAPTVPEDPNNLLYDGTFTRTASIASAESYGTVTYSSAHIWYQPSGSTAIVTDGSNKAAKLSQWIYQSVPVTANTTYRLTYKAKTDTAGASVTASVRALKDRSVVLKAAAAQQIDNSGDWKTYTTDISVGALNASYSDYTLGLTGTLGAGVVVDDLVFEQLFSISVSATGSGTASASASAVASGANVTFTAVPTGNATFLGWFAADNSSTPVSTDTVYTKTVTADISLIAKFSGESTPTEPEEPDNLLFDGTFSKTASVVAAESYDTVTYNSAHIWYRPSGSTSIQSESGNKYAALSEWIYQSAAFKTDTTYLLTFKAKSSVAGKTLSGTIRALKDRSKTLKNIFSYSTDGDGVWKEYAVLFTLDSFLSGYTDYSLGLLGTSGAGVCIDNVVLKQATGAFYTVTAAAFRGGKATVNNAVALPGGTVTFTATPDSGNTFRGWYKDGNTANPPVSTNLVYTTTVSSNLFMIAVFDGPGIPAENYSYMNPGAETGDTTGWTSSTGSTLSVTSAEKHGGSKAFKLETTAERQYLTTTQGILLKGYFTYHLSVWVKSTTIYPRVQLFTGTSYSEGVNDFVYADKIRQGYIVNHRVGGDVGALESTAYSAKTFTKTPDKYAGAVNGWVQYEMTFSTKLADAGTVVKFCIRNNSGTGTLYLDDLRVTETPIDIYASATNLTYCQWIYNLVDNPSFEDNTTDSDWGSTLQSGWEIKPVGGALGTKFLDVKNSGVFYKKISVMPDTQYNLGVSLKAASKSGSYIAIARDNKGTLFNNLGGKPASYVTPQKYNNTWERVGMKFTTPSDVSEVYLVIYNPSGSMSVDNIGFFKGQYGYATDPNDYTVRIRYDYEGAGYTGNDDPDNGTGDIPAGGDNPLKAEAICFTFIIAAAWVMFATRKREKKGEE